jgi:hypothetical protein
VLLERLPRDPVADADAVRSAPMKQIEVTIMGQSYVLGCPEGGEMALLEAVDQVDREMSAIRDGGKVRARERIAVLAALNLAYALTEDDRTPNIVCTVVGGRIRAPQPARRTHRAHRFCPARDGQLL